uniref:Uncharacterized protein n=1 Tax=Fagus sylvatica TaxID=28930 RepID=A0A2N9FH64_FAGSY
MSLKTMLGEEVELRDLMGECVDGLGDKSATSEISLE